MYLFLKYFIKYLPSLLYFSNFLNFIPKASSSLSSLSAQVCFTQALLQGNRSTLVVSTILFRSSYLLRLVHPAKLELSSLFTRIFLLSPQNLDSYLGQIWEGRPLWSLVNVSAFKITITLKFISSLSLINDKICIESKH